jgi:flagellar biosynthesis/type III secretory pathway protein FliH
LSDELELNVEKQFTIEAPEEQIKAFKAGLRLGYKNGFKDGYEQGLLVMQPRVEPSEVLYNKPNDA